METLDGKRRERIDAKLPDEAGDCGRFPSNLSIRKVTGRFISQDRKNRNSFPVIAIERWSYGGRSRGKTEKAISLNTSGQSLPSRTVEAK